VQCCAEEFFEARSIVILAPSRMPEMREWRQQPKGGREMRPQRFVKASLVACLVAAGLMLAGPAFGQQGGPPPGKGGGGHTEAAVNNLSYPAAMIGVTVSNPGATPLESTSDVFKATYSYGCDVPQTIGTTTYPNYSCIDAAGVYLNAADCAALDVCKDKTVSRIYWQKVPTSYWKAEETATPPLATVQYLDWGDNLESKSWTTTSTIRVETTPFADHGSTVLKHGYQMWHVSGQGTDEVWGVRAAFEGEDGTPPTAVYSYDHQYSILHTTQAMINFTKLSKGPATCPTVYVEPPEYQALPWTGTSWTGACSVKTEPYTAELNVGGKYVYGYNWTIRRDTLPTECAALGYTATDLAGWWRLTFYTPGSTTPGAGSPAAVWFNVDLTGEYLAPPPAPLLVTPEELLLVAPEEGDTGDLYRPKVISASNLTYIDICIKSGGGGGGRK
jgi:hypothetical protein